MLEANGLCFGSCWSNGYTAETGWFWSVVACAAGSRENGLSSGASKNCETLETPVSFSFVGSTIARISRSSWLGSMSDAGFDAVDAMDMVELCLGCWWWALTDLLLPEEEWGEVGDDAPGSGEKMCDMGRIFVILSLSILLRP